MSLFDPLFKHDESIISILLIAIGVCLSMTFLFLVLLYARRLKKIFDEKLKKRFTPIIDNFLFPLLFNDMPVDQIIESTDYQIHSKDKLFQKNLLQSIIKLHTNYSGDYNLKLQEFYRGSGLIGRSFAKLKSDSWSTICEGIRELSEMDIQEAYDDIIKLIAHKHSTLKLEALLGIIRLKGLIGLVVLNDYREPINDWIQLNLMYEINNIKHKTAYDFSVFLVSANESLIILGLRLISNFNQVENIAQINELMNTTNSDRIKKQAQQTSIKLASLNFNYSNQYN